MTVPSTVPVGTVLNNTVNVTYQNGTSALLSENASTSTTVTSLAPPTPGGGSGGGGPGGARRNITNETPQPITCIENWVCEEWSTCRDGVQSRECVDLNACGTTKYVPLTVRECKETLPVEEAEEEITRGVLNRTDLQLKEEEKPAIIAERKKVVIRLIKQAIDLFRASLWPLIFVILAIIMVTLAYWGIREARKREELGARGFRIERKTFYGRIERLDRRIEQVERKQGHIEPAKPAETPKKGPEMERIERPEPEEAVLPPVVVKPAKEKRFYSRLEEIDRKLAKLDRTRKHLAKKVLVKPSQEERRIEKELVRMVRSRFKVRPARPLHLPEAPVKKEEEQAEKPKPQVQHKESPTIKEIEENAREKFRMKKPKERKRFYSRLKDIDKELENIEKRLKKRGKQA